MKKRILSMLMTLVMIVTLLPAAMIPAAAATGDMFVLDGITYSVTAEDAASKTGTVSVVNSNDATGTVIVIPETVQNGEYTYTVNYLGGFTYRSATQLYLPSTIKDTHKIGGGVAHAPIFTEKDPGLIIYYTDAALGRLWVGSNKGNSGGYSFDESSAIACTNGGTLKSDAVWNDGEGVLNDVFEREYCTFGGWFDNQLFTGTAVTARKSPHAVNERYYALWNPDDTHAIVMYDSNFGTVDFGETIDINTAPTHTAAENTYSATQYLFMHWELSIYNDGTWTVEDDNVVPGENFHLEGGTIYKLTAQWELDPSIMSFSDTIVSTYQAYDSAPGSSAKTYYNLWVQSNATGIKSDSFTWYKYDGSTWVKVTENVVNRKNGRYTSSRLYFPNVVTGAKYKCVLTIGEYILEKETTVTIIPASVTVTAKPQTISKDACIDTIPSNSTVTISKRTVEDLSNSTVYGKTQLVLVDGVDTSVPGIYENAVMVVDNGLTSISNAPNYDFAFVPGQLTVKGTPTITWNSDNVYEYSYTGKPVQTNIGAAKSSEYIGDLGEPTGALKILYNGSETIPTEAGEYTIKAVYTSSSANYDSCEIECSQKLKIMPADLSISIKPQAVTVGASLPAIDAEDLNYSSETLTQDALNTFKAKINTVISEGKLYFQFKNGNQEIADTNTAGIYTIFAVISDENRIALDPNINVTFDSSTGGILTIKDELSITMCDMTVTYTGDSMEYDWEKNVEVSDPEVVLGYEYYNEDGYRLYDPPTDAGEYTVKVVFEGSEDYNGVEAIAKFIIQPAEITVTANRAVGRGDLLAEVSDFIVEDFVVTTEDANLEDELNEVKAFISNMLWYDLLIPYFDVNEETVAQNNTADILSFKFNINGSQFTMEELMSWAYLPINPSVAEILDLPLIFQNLVINFEKGDLIVKEKVGIDFKSAGVFTLEDADSSYNVDKALITEFTNEDIKLSADNIAISGAEGKPAPSGAVTIMYRHESDDDTFYDTQNYPFFGNWYAKVIVAEDENYARTEEEVLITVLPAKLIITAKDQAIEVDDKIETGVDAIVLEGAILSNAEMHFMLTEALPMLLEYEILKVKISDGIDTGRAGVYESGVKVEFDSSKLVGDYADAAAFFDIETAFGKLTVTERHTNHCACGGSVTVGGHTHDVTSPAWTPWDGTSEITYDTNGAAYVYLLADVNRTDVLSIPTGKILNLCLNGNTLRYTGSSNNSVIVVAEGATLNLTDCGKTGQITGGAGTATVNSNIYGGGIYNNGTFNMYDGNIAENNATARGGGVYNDGTFTMYGGSITENHAAAGGGVYNDGTFTMYDGTITGNTGGGVYTSAGLAVSGKPYIYENTDNGNADNVVLDGNNTVTVTDALQNGALIGVKCKYNRQSESGHQIATVTYATTDMTEVAQHFVSDYNLPIYADGSSLCVGYCITAEPDTDNYTVEVNDQTGIRYQWCKAELTRFDVVDLSMGNQVDSDIAALGDILGIDEATYENIYSLDKEQKCFQPVFSSDLYHDIEAYACFTIAFKQSGTVKLTLHKFGDGGTLDTLLLYPWNGLVSCGEPLQFTPNGDGSVSLSLTANAGSQFVLTSPNKTIRIQGELESMRFTNIPNQQSATLDITDSSLETGSYSCLITWDLGTADPEDDYRLTSENVEYVKSSYVITTAASVGGSVEGNGDYPYGDTVTLTATPDTGYRFVGWTENGETVSTDEVYNFISTSNRTLTANFAINTYGINITANPTEGGTVAGAGAYGYGESVTLTATPNTDYTFTNWTKSGEVVSTTAIYTFTATETCTLVANFVQKAVVSIDETAQNYVWDGGAKAFAITGTPNDAFTVQYMVSGSWTQDAPTNVGSYDVKITRAEDSTYQAYESVIPAGLAIAVRNASANEIAVSGVNTSYVYTGNPIHPTITVTVGGTMLEKGTDYTVSYGANTNVAAGGSVTVTLTGNYSGKKTVNFTIQASDQADFSITGATTAIYGGSSIALNAAGGSGNGTITWTITSGREFAEIAGNGATATLTIKGAGTVVVQASKASDGNYNTKVDTHEIIISKATISASNFSYTAPDDLVYSKIAKTATVTGNEAYGTITVQYYSDSTLTNVAEPTNVGTYYVGISTAGGANYEALSKTLIGSFEITARLVTVSAHLQTIQYGDDIPELTYTHNLIEGDYFSGTLATTASKVSDVGEYDIMQGTLNAGNNYAISFAGAKLTITKADGPSAPTVTGSYMDNGMTYTYTVTAIDGAEYSKNGSEWQDSNVFTALSAGQKYTFYARIKGTKNVLAGAIGQSAMVDLSKLCGVGTVTMGDWTYGETAKTPITTSTTGNAVESYLYESTDGKGYSSANVPTNAGEYKVTVTFKATDTHNGTTASDTFTIEKATPVVTPPTGLTSTYGDTLANVQLNTDWAWKDAATTEVGNAGQNSFAVIYTHPTDAANHNQIEDTVTITVSPKAVTATISVIGENFIFNDNEQKPGVTVKDGEITIPESEYTISYTNNLNAGTAAVTVTNKDGGNYIVSGMTTFEIVKKASSALSGVEREFLRTIATIDNEIDVEAMLPDNHGTVNYTITSSNYTVLENVNVDANGKLVFDTKTSATAVSDTITVKVEMQNYSDVTLTVSVILSDKTPQEITGVSAVTNLIYNGKAQQGYIGTPVSEKYAGIYEITYTGRDNSYNSPVAPTDAGDYTVTFKIPDTDPYCSGNIGINFTIGKAQATVTADDKEAYIGNRMPTLTYKVSGLLGGDTISVELSCDTSMNRAGETPIMVTATDPNGNYEISTANATLTVKYYPYIPLPTYDVEIADNITGGEVSASKNLANRGNTITLTVAPDAGYELTELTVTDSRGNAIVVTKISDTTYSFKMPSYDIKIDAVFAKIDTTCHGDENCPMYSYSDLDMTAWYHDGVHFCIENKLMNGMRASEFAPGATTSRAMIITILWRLAGEPVVNYAMSFEDVATDAWYTEAIRWAASVGIVNGYSNTAFGPNDNITREQLATILYRYEQNNGGGFKGMWMFRMDYFDLAAVSDWAYEAMCWMNMNSIVNGKPGKVLDPKGSATRAEAATMLYRYCDVIGKDDEK